MTEDLEKFSASKQFCLRWSEGRASTSVGEKVATLAGITFVPAIIVCCWLGEQRSWDEDVIKVAKSLINFYGYTKIENLPSGTPNLWL